MSGHVKEMIEKIREVALRKAEELREIREELRSLFKDVENAYSEVVSVNEVISLIRKFYQPLLVAKENVVLELEELSKK